MSGLLNSLSEMHQQHKERREERHEAHHERHGHGRQDNYETYNNEGQQGGRRHHGQEDYPNQHPSQGQFQGQGYDRGYAPPAGAPPPHSGRGPSGFQSQGGLERGDFASDDDIARMVASGDFDGRSQGSGRAGGDRRGEYGRYDASSGPPPGQGYGGRGEEYGRYDAPSGPPPGQGYGERTGEYGRYDSPSGPPPGRAHQNQPTQEGYGSGGGPNRRDQYESSQTQGRSQRDSAEGFNAGYGKSQGNAPSGGFTASRDGENQYGGPRRGEAASYYDQQDQGDRYAHLAGIAQEHGNDDPEVYRKATQGLQDRIQAQAQSSRPNEDSDMQARVDAHRKAYGGDDHGPMDADAIGAAAAMEAFKQTAAAANSNAPTGAFKTTKTGGDTSSKPGGAATEEEEEEDAATAARGGGGGMQDKLMALAMSHAGKLFDKKNAGSAASSGNNSQDKAQAMQSAAATAMQLFSQYQTKGKLDSGDMSKVLGLAMNLF